MPYRVKVADLEALIKTDAAKVKKLEQRSAEGHHAKVQIREQASELFPCSLESSSQNLGRTQSASSKRVFNFFATV